jgi:IS605 OrfB family transposase
MLKRMPSFQLLADRRQLERDGTCRNWTAKVSLRLEPAGPGLRFQAAHGVRRSEITEIPGLRVLGTNLGLRVACGWSVWETATLEEACAQLGRNPSADEEHLCAVSAKSGRIDYRRIGANDAPAPFARLIAEGLVPYDGDEDRPPTMLEQAVVGKILRRFGGTTVPGWSVWRLTEDTVKAVKKGLRAHADLARVISVLSNPESDAVLVANAMTAWWRGAALRPASSLGFLWAELARPIADTAEPSGEPAKWAKKLGAPAFSVPTTGQLGAVCQALRSDKAAIGVLSARWVRDDTLLRHALRLVELVVFGGTLTPELAVYADGGRSGSLARFVSRAPNPPVLAGVGGGRRPRRVGLFDDVRKLQVAYFTRRHPDGTQAELPEGFGWRLMEKRRKTVTDISKQVASAIVLQAVRNGAHVVVAEDLSSYKTSGANDPDTNRRLRLWTKGQVAMYLEQLCELHGLVYASTNPAWASWRDSRDGRLGYRVEPVAVAQIRAKGSEVRKRFDREVAEAKRIDGDASEHKKVVAAALVDLAERLPGILENAADGAYVVVPRRGGRWFAPADVRVGMLLGPDDVRHDGTVPLGLRQADSNAAGNTAVRWVRGRVSNR